LTCKSFKSKILLTIFCFRNFFNLNNFCFWK